MPELGTFAGSTIVGMPSTPAPKSIEWTAQDVVGVSTSPFTGQQQVMDWQASWLEASVQMPPMAQGAAQAWISWLLQARGQAGVFQLGDPAGQSPRGNALTASGPVAFVDGAGQSGYRLRTKLWAANTPGVLLPGDWIQLGYRLYRNLDQADADGGGNVTLNIWPQLREEPLNNLPVIVQNTRGLWRLKTNARKWSLGEARIYGLTFDIREAL